jgi:hypothetical protein
MALLKGGSAAAQEEAVATLGNLSHWEGSSRGVVAQLPDLMPTLMTLMSSSSSSSSSSSMVRELALGVVADLSCEPVNWPLLSRQQGLNSCLVGLLAGSSSSGGDSSNSSSSLVAQGKVVHVLAHLARHSASNAERIVASGAVPGIIRLLRQGQPQAQEAAAATLVWLAHRTPDATFQMAVKQDLVPGLMHVLSSNRSTPAAQECAAAVVAGLARRGILLSCGSVVTSYSA